MANPYNEAALLEQFKAKYKGAEWRADWNNYPNEEDGFNIVTDHPKTGETVQAAHTETQLLALVIRDALNAYTH